MAKPLFCENLKKWALKKGFEFPEHYRPVFSPVLHCHNERGVCGVSPSFATVEIVTTESFFAFILSLPLEFF